MNRQEMRDEEEKLAPWAQAAYEAWVAGDTSEPPWAALSTVQRRPWVEVADAVLNAYDDQWQHEKAGL